jgi:hypothetical protein
MSTKQKTAGANGGLSGDNGQNNYTKLQHLWQLHSEAKSKRAAAILRGDAKAVKAHQSVIKSIEAQISKLGGE